jgi:hypothetical protein
MDDTQEIKELLREIRDLQKAHFERYKEFTEAVLAHRKETMERTERARAESARFQEQTLRASAQSDVIIRKMQFRSWITFAIIAALLVLILALRSAPWLFNGFPFPGWSPSQLGVGNLHS